MMGHVLHHVFADVDRGAPIGNTEASMKIVTRHHERRVFLIADQNFVAGFPVDGPDNDIEPFGGVVSEGNLVGLGAQSFGGEWAARVLRLLEYSQAFRFGGPSELNIQQFFDPGDHRFR